MKTPAQTYDWSMIKRLYTGGQTAYAISKMEGMPSKQAVMYRAKREQWDIAKAEVAALLPSVNDSVDRAGKAARILERLRNGATHALAARAEGIHPETWRLWRVDDALLQDKAQEAMAQYVATTKGHIDTAAARDWKAAAWLLERHPESRDELKPRESKGDNQGLTVVLNIDRARATVSEDGRTLTVEPE